MSAWLARSNGSIGCDFLALKPTYYYSAHNPEHQLDRLCYAVILTNAWNRPSYEQPAVANLGGSAGELITENSGTAMGLSKELIARLHGMNLVDALDFAANVNAAARMTTDCKQGIDAFLQKTTPKW